MATGSLSPHGRYPAPHAVRPGAGVLGASPATQLQLSPPPRAHGYTYTASPQQMHYSPPPAAAAPPYQYQPPRRPVYGQPSFYPPGTVGAAPVPRPKPIGQECMLTIGGVRPAAAAPPAAPPPPAVVERPGARVVDVQTRGEGYDMFDMDKSGKLLTFDLRQAMEACGYDMHEDQMPVLFEAFGVPKGASITKTEFHAICDYFEGVVAHNTGRSDAALSPERRRQLRAEAIQRQAGKRDGIPDYTHFPGWEPPGPNGEAKKWRPQPDALSIRSDDLDSAHGGDNPLFPPPHLRPGSDGADLPPRDAAFKMFDVDGSGQLSVFDLPGALAAAGFRGVRPRPHVASLLHVCGLAEATLVTLPQFYQLCDRLTADGLRGHSKEP
eukprot:TRINITY_DN12324_c0_g1_i1.p1 TRINITY_DN12324_c0_g1~~TRINITY_DN12324_c0_g1_i1.p1  ORF type:complete len:406 (+),score=112.43 TRINITY_DN12324_c0_g1_i1:77-1219(+)